MRPFFETLSVPEGQSWTLLHRRLDDEIPFQWHYHREFELTLTLNSHGQRYVGDHVGTYDDGDLVLLGPNLPHTWASRGKFDAGVPHVAIVMWFRPEWIEALVQSAAAELRSLRAMLAGASRGLRFSNATAAAVRPTIQRIVDLAPERRLPALLDVLLAVARDHAMVPLASPSREQQSFAPGDRLRIERVLDHIHARYQHEIRIEALASLAHLSTSGLHRMFKRHAKMTVLDYVAQLRIGRACQLLISTSKPIAHIAGEAGYDNLSHFNRQFRAVKHTTPRAFRRGFGTGGASGRQSTVGDAGWTGRPAHPVGPGEGEMRPPAPTRSPARPAGKVEPSVDGAGRLL